MKKLLLSGIVALHTFVSMQAMEPARPQVWKILDAVLPTSRLDPVKDWAAVFKLLDEMKGIINVNEYRTVYYPTTLLTLAVERNLFAVAQLLLEKYGANPSANNNTALIQACATGDIPMIQLLMQHGANPYLKDRHSGVDAFEFVRFFQKNNPAILKILNEYKK
jgi:hypothetical protein